MSSLSILAQKIVLNSADYIVEWVIKKHINMADFQSQFGNANGSVTGHRRRQTSKILLFCAGLAD